VRHGSERSHALVAAAGRAPAGFGSVEAPVPPYSTPSLPDACRLGLTGKGYRALSVHQFAVGDHVNLWRRRFGKRFWMGEYEITQLLPLEAGQPNYRIQGARAANQRAASEDLLTIARRLTASRR
jgi:hypothetical protein